MIQISLHVYSQILSKNKTNMAAVLFNIWSHAHSDLLSHGEWTGQVIGQLLTDELRGRASQQHHAWLMLEASSVVANWGRAKAAWCKAEL